MTAPIASPEGVVTHDTAREAWEQTVDGLFATTFHAAPHLSVSEWAEANRRLSKETSAEPGPWRNDRTPYLIEIQDCLSDPEVTELVVKKSARVGYTEGVMGNGIGYFIDQDPAPILVIQPTEGDAEDWSKTQLVPMLRDSPCLTEKLPESKSRDSGNTILDKHFPGGSIKIRGGHSPRGLRRVTARVVFFDEVSALVASAGAEGDPVKLGETRADTFPNRKVVKGSTPTVKGFCRISKDFARTDQRYYHVPCPHCGFEQVLRWGGPDTPYGIKWERTVRCTGCRRELEEGEEECPACKSREREVEHDADSAFYLCVDCGSSIEEHQKPEMIRRGRWIASNPGARVRGYHINALVSLISDKARWPNLVREWLEAQEDRVLLQVFVNTVLGEEWSEKVEKMDPATLAGRAEEWRTPEGARIEVPEGVGILTAFVDVQGDRIEVLVKGWGEREESWMIAHHRIYGDITSDPTVWPRLDALRVREWTCAGGAKRRIMVLGVDSGDGTRVNEIYDYVRPRQGEGVYATKGQPARQREPIRMAKRPDKSGIRRIDIGTYPMKNTLFSRLALKLDPDRPTPSGYIHFRARDPEWHNGADAEFYAQFARETLKPVRQKDGTWIREYVKTGPNEAIDLEVGNLAMLHALGPAVRQTLGEYVRAVKEEGERIRAAKAEAPPVAPPPPPSSAAARRSSWINNW